MRKLWFFCVLFFFCETILAQDPVVNFTATPLTGCSPLVVTFTDQSTGNPTNWDWDLGNGQLSTARNPVVVYNIPGVYTVKLVVRNANGIAALTKTDYITVNPTPTAAFTASTTTGCAPNSIRFTDQSTAPGSSVTSWRWNFGDGSTSTEQNPVHTYQTPGYYDVSLTISSTDGCNASTNRYRYIRIVPGVVANFSPTAANTCQAPFAVTLNNQSSGPGNLTYNWQLGNGTTSNVQSPAAVYTTPGTYSIRLITTSDYGCADTVQQDIPFTNNTTAFTAPDTTCLNIAVNFVNNSSPAPLSSTWDFGDGTVSGSGSPQHTYDSVGVYAVKLINNYGNCVDSVIRNITVGPKPTVDFSSVASASCKAPFTVQFQNQTPNSTAWIWDFGDGTSSTEQNPSHTYNGLGQFDITLTATFNGGCQNTIVKPIFVKLAEPTASISNLPAGGCVPYTFTPVAAVNAVDGVATWFWNFGDGTTSSAANPTHVYNTPGSYDITLRITTTTGCTREVVYPAGVKAGRPITADFSADKFDVCASEPVTFTDLSPGADEWFWQFGDGTVSNEQNPVHIFQDTGFMSVSLTALSNRCGTTETKTAYIRITPPIARFAYSVDCDNKLRVNFRDSSIIDPALGTPTYSWTFGSGAGSGTSTQLNPTFTFPSFGSHPVTLTVTNGTCSFTYVGEVLLTDERARFTSSKRTVCRDEEFTLTATPANPANIKYYEWTVGNDAPVLDTALTLLYRIRNGGSFPVRLVIIDSNFCRDTLVVSDFMQVVGPVPDFGPEAAGTCPNTDIRFIDKTTSAAPLVKWTWDYGDGTRTDYTTNGPFVHRYQDVGVYGVRLTVTDNLGCTATRFIEDTVIVTSPTAGFVADTIFCPGVNLNFRDTSAGRNLRYLWTFGDGNTSALQNPANAYPAGDRNYSVTLKITDQFGCSDSVSKAAYIKVRSPKAGFTAEDTTGICPPLEARFTLNASDYQSFYWDFGDGSPASTAPNPRHFYNNYNVFTTTLVAVGYGGCVDSASHRITVSDPNSTRLVYDPLEACNALNVNFQLKPPAYSRYVLYYGDGLTNQSQDTAFSHFYRGPAFFYPSIFLTDSSGCQVSLTSYPPIRVIGAKPLFGSDKKEFCDTANVAFSNFTIFNDPVVSYNWNFGDGSVSSDFAPTHYYAQPGVNVVSLTVTTARGCTDVLNDTIRAYRTPVASISIPDTVCINTPALFGGHLAVADTNTVNWQWSFGNGQSANVQNPAYTYTNVGDYIVNLKTSVPFGCTAEISKPIFVPPAPTVSVPSEIQIISGSGITIPAVYTGDIANYKWAPSQRLDCDNCPTPYANPAKTTKYKITATDIYGCVVSSDLTIHVVCGDRNLFVPNTFSPNGDGANDVFFPRGTGVFNVKSLQIFNRWGEKVFERANFNANTASSGWDGTFKGKRAPQDTYVYAMEIVCENSEVSTFKGNVTLIR
ncbi:MAG: PKD domain-containing protein [Chitinophagaceae bacterium]|nr:MAG: PKD domain-containing protein [Chitinophagaceae bacterium]